MKSSFAEVPQFTLQCPCEFEQAFLDDMPYEPRVLLLDRIEKFDPEQRVVVCRMPTDVPMPFTDAQRAHPIKHPRHVSGAAMVHVTGMLGFVHVYYMHGFRHADGWIGYGTHVNRASFRKLVTPGAPLICECREVKARFMGKRVFVTYDFCFLHEGEVAYESNQSAMWIKTQLDSVES